MYRKQKEVLIIIPAYNEEKTIGELLTELEQPEISEIADILVMNDASLDKTAEVVRDRGHEVITHIYNLGYGSGLQVGYRYALQKHYRYVIQMDADRQHDVCNVKNLYQALKTKDAQGRYPDIVLGSRFIDGSVSFPISGIKKFAIHMFSTFIKLSTGKEIHDPTTGLQGLNMRAVRFYAGYGHFDDRYPDANIIMQMLLLGFCIKEIPAIMHERTEGVSMHSGLKPILYMMRMMFSIAAVWIRIKIFKVDVGIMDEKVVS